MCAFPQVLNWLRPLGAALLSDQIYYCIEERLQSSTSEPSTTSSSRLFHAGASCLYASERNGQTEVQYNAANISPATSCQSCDFFKCSLLMSSLRVTGCCARCFGDLRFAFPLFICFCLFWVIPQLLRLTVCQKSDLCG